MNRIERIFSVGASVPNVGTVKHVALYPWETRALQDFLAKQPGIMPFLDVITALADLDIQWSQLDEKYRELYDKVQPAWPQRLIHVASMTSIERRDGS